MARFIGCSVALGLLGLSCCHNGKVLLFKPDRELICAGESVLLTWEVKGDAQLTAQPPPPDWRVDKRSKGTLEVRPQVTTVFTMTALDANPAKNGAYGTRTIQVRDAQAPETRGTSAPCDATTRLCSNSVQLSAGPGLRIAGISKPMLVRQGVQQPREVCVTPPSGVKACVADGEVKPVDSPAAGKWTFEAKLADGESDLPPPKLQVQVDFACQPSNQGGRS